MQPGQAEAQSFCSGAGPVVPVSRAVPMALTVLAVPSDDCRRQGCTFNAGNVRETVPLQLLEVGFVGETGPRPFTTGKTGKAHS